MGPVYIQRWLSQPALGDPSQGWKIKAQADATEFGTAESLVKLGPQDDHRLHYPSCGLSNSHAPRLAGWAVDLDSLAEGLLSMAN